MGNTFGEHLDKYYLLEKENRRLRKIVRASQKALDEFEATGHIFEFAKLNKALRVGSR